MSKDLVLTLNNGIKTVRGGGSAGRRFINALNTAPEIIPNNVLIALSWANAIAAPGSNIPFEGANNGLIIPRPGNYNVSALVQWSGGVNGFSSLLLLVTPPGGVETTLAAVIDTLDDTNAEEHSQYVQDARFFEAGTLLKIGVTQASGAVIPDRSVTAWGFIVFEV